MSSAALFANIRIGQAGIPLIRQKQYLSEVLRNSAKETMCDEGMQVHGAVLRTGYESDVMINTGIIDMYAKCGRIENARSVFDRMSDRDVVSWACLMAGYLRLGDAKASLLLFKEMGCSNVSHNDYTLSTNIKACGILGALESGKQIHAVSCKTGLDWYPAVGDSIVDMYFKCRRIGAAERMFNEMPVRHLITWNTMIGDYANLEGMSDKSLHLLKEMQEQGEMPDEFTFTSTLKACRRLGAILAGKQIHAFVIRHGYSISSHKILAGALIDLYAQSGYLSEAHHIFRQAEEKSMISWTALILGYARKGDLLQAMHLFRELRRSSISLASFALSSIIALFADFANVELGKQLHCYTIKVPSDLDLSVANSVLDMYLKCGFMEEADRLFSKMQVKNVYSYTVMITGYGKHRLNKEAVQLFKKMQAEKINPDPVTYSAVLVACSHSGLVDESLDCFTRLCNDQTAKPKTEHYALMIDFLGQAGRLKEAKELLEKMPMKPFPGIGQTLIDACRLHGDLEMGRQVGEFLLRMDCDNLVNYVLLSNIYAEAGCLEECEKLKKIMKARHLKKEAGCSW